MEKEILTRTQWTLDRNHSQIHFQIRHLMISWVSGNFTEFHGSFESKDDNFENPSVDLTVMVDSISTGNKDRDDHLRSIDFFDAGQFPEIRFFSKGIHTEADGKMKISGEINIHGISREITLDMEFSGISKDPWGNEKAGFSISGEINRNDFGINWNTPLENGGILIGNHVKIRIDIQLAKAA